MKRSIPAFIAAVLFLPLGDVAQAQGPRPSNAFQFRLGGFFPSGNSDFWDVNQETFTLDASDFRDVAFGFSYVAGINNHLELGFNVDFFDETVRSAYRGWRDDFGYPILHDTRLETIPMTVDLRFLPGGRYGIRGTGGQRRVLQPVPYLGVGAGFNYWEYEEQGDFLDFGFDPPVIYPDRFVESGTEVELHALAGVELPLRPTVSFLLEARYSWCEADLGGDFAGLGDLDLGGFYGYFGLAIRF